MFTKWQGYAPDADPTTPGIITDCTSLVPTLKGMAAAPSAVSTGLTLAAACRGGATVTELDGTNRVLAGSATKLYEASGGSWTDRTRGTGGDYALTGEYRWRFAQFGSVTLAAAKTDVLQLSTAGAFQNASSSPVLKAGLIETVENFVMVADTNETTYGDCPDRWWCSAIRDPFTWTPSVDVQCATNTIVGAPGRITALKRFGENIIAYKLRAMFRGTYVGQPEVFLFPMISGEIGALCHEAVVDIGTQGSPVHAFMGEDDFYIFDGSMPRPIGTNAVKEAVYGELLRSKQYSVIGVLDRTNSLVRWYYPTVDSVNPNRCVVWNYKVNKWGRDDRQIEAGMDYIASGLTYDQLGSAYGTYSGLPDAPYDSAFLSGDARAPAVFDTSHVLRTLNGTPGASSLTTGDWGGDDVYMHVTRVRPRFTTKPSSGSLTNYYRHDLGDSLTVDSGASLNGSKFDIDREAKWHRFVMTFSGRMETQGVNIDADSSGDE